MLGKGVLKIKDHAGIRTWKLLQLLDDPNEIPSMPVKKKKIFFFPKYNLFFNKKRNFLTCSIETLQKKNAK
jgi:hypothetical protein